MNKIAVLLTCFNRREKTLACLANLYNADLPNKTEIEVFLVDDGSTDGTTEAVKKNFDCVEVIQGTGSLFWNKGMRLAWETAVQKKDFDFYFWLNDDTTLEKNAILDFFDVYHSAKKIEGKPVIVVGACKQNSLSSDFSYGGKTQNGPVIPNGNLQKCKFMNGNAVLIPKEIFLVLGNLSADYTHTMGDIDYGLRAIKKGFSIYTTKSFVAICETNKGFPVWCNPEKTLAERWKFLHAPQGLNISEYNRFRKKFWGAKWLAYATKVYLRTLFPKFYNKFSNIEG